MSRLDRYILSQLLLMFGFFSLVLVSVDWVNRAVILFERLISDGESLWTFVEFSLLSLPHVMHVVLPISAFVATVFVTSRALRDGELVVMKAAGCSPFRLARPVLVFGLAVGVFLMAIMHFLLPESRARMADRQEVVAQNITARLLTEGRFQHPAAGITVYIGTITPEGELRDIYLSDHRDPEHRTEYTASSALIAPGAGGPKLVMLDGLLQSYSTDGQRLATMGFSDFTYDIGALVSESAGLRAYYVLDTWSLLTPTEGLLAETGATRAQFLQEGYFRLAQPFFGVVTALIGFGALMLGGFSRLGIWRQISGAIAVVAVAQFLNNWGASMGMANAAYAPLAFAPVAFGIGAAALMLWIAGLPRRVTGAVTGAGAGAGANNGEGGAGAPPFAMGSGAAGHEAPA